MRIRVFSFIMHDLPSRSACNFPRGDVRTAVGECEGLESFAADRHYQTLSVTVDVVGKGTSERRTCVQGIEPHRFLHETIDDGHLADVCVVEGFLGVDLAAEELDVRGAGAEFEEHEMEVLLLVSVDISLVMEPASHNPRLV